MNPVEMRHDDVTTLLGWLYQGGLPNSIQELLKQADQKRSRPELDYNAARDCCWQALKQIGSGSLSSAGDSSVGIVRIHLGATYYAEGNLKQAIKDFSEASDDLTLHRHNHAVAQFALGLAYACQREPTKVYEHVTREVLDTLSYGAEAKQVNDKWAQIRERLSRPESPIDPPPPPPSDKAVIFGPDLERSPLVVPSVGTPSRFRRVIIIGALVAVILGGAILSYAFSSRWPGPITYLVVVAILTYLLTKRWKCKVQQDQALVIETGGASKVCWGPGSYYRWPFTEHFLARVPLGPILHMTPPKNIQLASGKKLDIKLMIYYGVDASHAQNVLNSVYRTQPETVATGSIQGAKKEASKVYTPEDLRRAWEKRLQLDMVATLNEVLPGLTYDQIGGELANEKARIANKLRQRLALRVHEWGMAIQEVSIADAAMNKT